jgi:PSMD12/CSN4, N-terminal
MVQVVMGFLDSAPKLETKLSTIETLRTVTEGKIFVEVERARVTKILSDIKKEQGDLKAAKDILCELQVETFGSMERREKTEFILAQVALCIESEDWTQAGILSRKISTKYLSRKPKKTEEQLEKEKKDREKKRAKGEDIPEPVEDDVTDLKLRYYEQQITLAKHDDKYLDACKHYRQVLDTEAVEEDPLKLHSVRIPICSRDSSNFPRSCKELSTMSSSPPTTTNNPTSFTEFRRTLESIKCPSMRNFSSSSLFTNSCDGQKSRSCLGRISAAQMCLMSRKASLQIRRHTNDGKTFASV